MKRKLKKKPIIIFFIILIFIIGGIASIMLLNKDETEKPQNDIKEPTKEPEKEEPKVQIVNLDSKTRPYAVMINNLGAARPYHTGLDKAYLVYEIIVEGGITRYLALFKDNLPEVVGSVRSARHYYLDYVMENDAFYVHWGWSPQAQSDIKTLGINNINGLSLSKPYFFRQKLNVSSEHTGYANISAIKDYVTKKNWRTETDKGLLLNYSANPINNNKTEEDALKVDLKYSTGFTTNYVYDSETKLYKQFVNNKAHTDYETKEQYTVKNIITYQVNNNNISGDNKGRQDLNNIGSGTGYFITEGKKYEITWEKSSRSSKTIYKYPDGTPITVNDGNTWIHIVPKNGNITIS